MPDPARFDPAAARRFLAELFDPSAGCFEVRIPRSRRQDGYVRPSDYHTTQGGYYDDLARAVRDLHVVQDVSAYVTVNPVNASFLGRKNANKFGPVLKDEGTKDSDVTYLDNILVDVDSVRAAGVSATEAEHGAAQELLARILGDHPEIRAACWWGSSGNGGWILPRIGRLPNDAAGTAMVKRFLVTLGRMYSGPAAKVDPATHNPSRIMGIPGLRKCKGSSTADRPWRVATILSPIDHVRGTLDLAAWLAAHDDGEPAPNPRWDAVAGAAYGAHGHPIDHDPVRVMIRVATFMAEIPEAISGQEGHDQTFSAATALIKGFGLTIAEAWPFLKAYNATCLPPWTDTELWHKIEDADEIPDDRPRGYLLNERNDARPATQQIDFPAQDQAFDLDMEADAGAAQLNGEAGPGGAAVAEVAPPAREGGPPPAPVDSSPFADNPDHLARGMLTEAFSGHDGRKLWFWRDEFHGWDGCRYVPLPKKEVAALVVRSVKGQFMGDYQARLIAWAQARRGPEGAGPGPGRPAAQPKLLPVTTRTVADVTLALSELALLSVRECPRQPVWLGGPGRWPAAEIMPTRSALVHLPSLVEGRPCTMPPTPRFFSRYSVSYGYDPNVPDPANWLAFLNQIWAMDPIAIATLQEWMGYLLTPDTSQQKIAMLIGPLRSGKGTISRVISAMLGDENCSSPTLSHLTTNFGAAGLVSKPVAIINDARISGRTDSAVVIERLLSISGEDSQTIDRKNKDEITTRLQTRFMIISNELPKLHDASGALAGRLLMMNLTRSFLGREDHGLMDRLRPELPGILKWSIEGWARLRQRGHFLQPESGRDLLVTMNDLASPMLAFLRERCLVGADEWISIDELYHGWSSWCQERGRDSPGIKDNFGRDLRSALAGVTSCQKRFGAGRRFTAYRGLRMLTSDELAAQPAEIEDDPHHHDADRDSQLFDEGAPY